MGGRLTHRRERRRNTLAAMRVGMLQAVANRASIRGKQPVGTECRNGSALLDYIWLAIRFAGADAAAEHKLYGLLDGEHDGLCRAAAAQGRGGASAEPRWGNVDTHAPMGSISFTVMDVMDVMVQIELEITRGADHRFGG